VANDPRISRRFVLSAAASAPALVLTQPALALVQDSRLIDRNRDLSNAARMPLLRLDLKAGGGDPGPSWYDFSGGTMIGDRNGRTGSDDVVEFSSVEVVGPLIEGTARADLLELLNEFASGRGERFNATLELLGTNQELVRSIDFYDCLPTCYAPPNVRADDDSVLEERFCFKPERVED